MRFLPEEFRYPHNRQGRVEALRVLGVPSEDPIVGLLDGQVAKRSHLPTHRIGDGVAEHVEEGGLEEGVELGEGLAALGPQGVRRIQNRRNPLLLGEGWERDSKRLEQTAVKTKRYPVSAVQDNFRESVKAFTFGPSKLASAHGRPPSTE